MLFCILQFLFSFGHIKSTNAFLHPLSAEEEAECLEAFASGSVEARNKLIEHNLRLVAYISKKFQQYSYEIDDLISIGTIGLIKSIQTFKASKGNRLATYASRCIENTIHTQRL